MKFNQIKDRDRNRIPIAEQDLSANFNFDSNFDSVLPRQSWQDRQAFARAIVKTKKALDIAEITHLLN